MDSFEYFIALTAIILGLGIAHLLAGLGKTVYRVTGNGKPLKLSWVHSLWVANVFFWMIAYWWYTFGHSSQQEWTFGAYLLMLPFPVLTYLQCVILYPNEFEDIADLDEYFMSTRRWFFAVMLLAIAADWLLVFIDPQAMAAYLEHLGWSVIIVVIYMVVVAIVGSIVQNTRLHVTMAVGALILGVWQIFDDHPVLGAVPF